MPEDKKPDLKLVAGGAAEDIFNDIESLRKTAELKVQRRVIPISMDVRKPPANGYFQCHPDPAQPKLRRSRPERVNRRRHSLADRRLAVATRSAPRP